MAFVVYILTVAVSPFQPAPEAPSRCDEVAVSRAAVGRQEGSEDMGVFVGILQVE